MSLAVAEISQLLDVAKDAALRGGSVLEECRPRVLAGRAARSKGVRRELVTEADREAERVVVGAILDACPEHAVLAEEGVLTPTGRRSRESDFLWIVDPLDGTTNYVHGIPNYCVAIAVAYRGEMVAAAVHAPQFATTYSAGRGLGAFQDDRRLAVSATAAVEDALLATGFSYVRNEPGRDDNVARAHRALMASRDLRRFGSAELDLCMTAAGIYDGYWELYLEPYDVAAGTLICREAGGEVTDLVGGDDWLHGGQILASNGTLHQRLLDLVGGAP